MADVSVRPAQGGDAETIATIQLEVWRTSFSAFLPAEVVNVDPAVVAASWRSAAVTPPDAHHHVLVAQEQQWVVGFAAITPADTDEPGLDAAELPQTATLNPILVQPRWGRRGHGSRLLAAAVEHATGDGTVRLISWVAEADQASRDFLLSAGWQVDGYARTLDTGAAQLREIRLHTVLADQP